MKKHLTLAIELLLVPVFLFGQVAVGEWRDHLPYSHVFEVVEAKNKIYAATDGGAIFYYDKTEKQYQKISKINGLSDVGVSAIGYADDYHYVIIGYANGNLDLLKDNMVINIPDIKNKMIYGSKSINHVMVVDDYAYLSCGFGIVVVDLEKNEIKERYYIGPDGEQIPVNEMAYNGTYLYAATDKGLYKANINAPNLIDFSNWVRLENIPNYDKRFNTITFFNDNIYVNHDSEISNNDEIYVIDADNKWKNFTLTDISNCKALENTHEKLVLVSTWHVDVWDKELNRLRHFSTEKHLHAIMDKDNFLWIGDNYNGLVKNEESWYKKSYYPTGPMYNTVTDFAISNNMVWAAAGGPADIWNDKGAFVFQKEEWKNINKRNYSDLEGIRNINQVAIDPEDPKHIWLGSYGYGVIEMNNLEIIKIYNSNNSILENISGYNKGYIRNTGLKFDKNNNLWMTFSGLKDPLYVVNNGNFAKIEMNFNKEDINNLTITKNNHIWFTAEKDNTHLFAYNYNNTIDDTDDDESKYFLLKNSNGETFNNILSMAEDKEGQLWVGTSQGVLVYYAPEEVFTNNDFYAQQIKIPRNDGSGLADLLLETESVTAIAIDGGNRKWFGTQNAGAFLFSADGSKQLKSFNKENSPLLSDNILTIEINQQTGEVYFGTGKGIISYRAGATEGNEYFENVYAFPNPVRENYHGDITITGMVENAIVKITDISGNIVYETEALGGQAIWNGKDFNGKRVHTGVYLVFCSSQDGSKTFVTKLLFIH